MLEPPRGEQRQRLVGDLISRFFTGYADVPLAKGEAFVDIDTGLAIMSHHAHALGYDGVILFLDELILWLATRAADVNFVSAEGAKLSSWWRPSVPTGRSRSSRSSLASATCATWWRATRRARWQLQFADTLKLLGSAVRSHQPGGPQPAADRATAASETQDDAARRSDRRRIRRILQSPQGGCRNTARLRRRADDVPTGLSVQPGAGAGVDRRVVGASAGAHRAEADADAAGGTAG